MGRGAVIVRGYAHQHGGRHVEQKGRAYEPAAAARPSCYRVPHCVSMQSEFAGESVSANPEVFEPKPQWRQLCVLISVCAV